MTPRAPLTIGDLAEPCPVVGPETLCRDVHRMFRDHEERRSIVVGGPNGAGPVLLNRTSFYQVMTGARGYGWALYSARPVAEILALLPAAAAEPAGTTLVGAGLVLLAEGGVNAGDDVLVTGPGGEAATLAVSTALRSVARSYARKVDAVAAAERRFRALVQGSSDAVGVLDADGTITYLSAGAERITGYRSAEREGRSAFSLMHPSDVPVIRRVVAGVAARPGAEAEMTFRLRRRDGGWRWMEGRLRNALDDDAVDGLIINFRDVTERRALQEKLHRQAFYDSLTGLPNRALIKDRAAQMLARAGRGPHDCAALIIDLDRFKDVNDVHGHSAGDALLVLVGERLGQALRPVDTVGRLGGDEFVVLVEGDSLGPGPEAVADRLLEALRAPFVVDGHTLAVTASIGIATGTRGDVDDLLRDADIALYRAKAAGRDNRVVFSPLMKVAVERRGRLAADLALALPRGEFLLQYQPSISLADRSVVGAEALLRWRHPHLGPIGPMEMVPLLEESGLIVPVGRWVLEESCRVAAALQEEGHAISMSVNISPRQLDDGHRLLDDVVRALGQSGLDADRLVLEITESALMRDAAATARHLTRVRSLGVRIAVDDFGTGFSSLAYLTTFPVDVLKVDRSFVAELGRSEQADALMRSVLDLGRALSLTTVAEGIEDATQLGVLRRFGCDLGQGFLLGRPAPPGTLRRMLIATAPAAPVAQH